MTQRGEVVLARVLEGKRILIVEDEFLIAQELKTMVEDWGGTAVGPATCLRHALALARSQELHGAILDVMLERDTCFPLADKLIAQGVPVVLSTSYDVGLLPERFSSTPKLPKLYTLSDGEGILHQAFG
jgi:CheY-like chemotaxis protein